MTTKAKATAKAINNVTVNIHPDKKKRRRKRAKKLHKKPPLDEPFSTLYPSVQGGGIQYVHATNKPDYPINSLIASQDAIHTPFQAQTPAANTLGQKLIDPISFSSPVKTEGFQSFEPSNDATLLIKRQRHDDPVDHLTDQFTGLHVSPERPVLSRSNSMPNQPFHYPIPDPPHDNLYVDTTRMGTQPRASRPVRSPAEELHLQRERERQRIRLANETPAQKEQRLAKSREKKAAKKNETRPLFK